MNPDLEAPVPGGPYTPPVEGSLPYTPLEFRSGPDGFPLLDDIVIDDGAPVDNVFIEKLLRLLTEPLYASWAGPPDGSPWVAFADVGLFYAHKQPPLAPDVMLAVGVEQGSDLSDKGNRSYFTWLRGKAPDVVIEVVSDRRGEATYKLNAYAGAGVLYYVIFDPEEILGEGVLRGFALQGRKYHPSPPDFFPEVGLGLKLWEGEYAGMRGTWLRWCDQEGHPIPTGKELADQAKQVADHAKQRAKQEKQQARQEKQRAEQQAQEIERLRAKLRELGIDPSA